MSRRLHDRSRQGELRPARSDAAVGSAACAPRAVVTALLVVLAAIASLVLAAIAIRPGSMAAATPLLRTEAARLNDAERARPTRTPNWTTVYAPYFEHVRSSPHAQRRAALAGLFQLLDQVSRTAVEREQTVQQAARLLQFDTENRLARLVYACIHDQLTLQQPSADTMAFDLHRFEAMSDILEARPPAERATLYNAELTRARFDALRRHFRRPDVAASLTVANRYQEIEDHYERLPEMARRLRRLAESLETLGHRAEAARCRAWFVHTMLELIAAETSAETRLLCADLAARMLPAEAPSAKVLADFRAAFHRAVDAADTDLCSQDNILGRNPAPGAYHRAMVALVAAGAFAAAAAGGAVSLVLSVLAAPVSVWRSRRAAGREASAASQRPPSAEKGKGQHAPGSDAPRSARHGAAHRARLAAAAAPGLAVLPVVWHFHQQGLYSVAWIGWAGALLAAAGLFASLWLALSSGGDAGVSPRRVRLLAGGVVVLLAAAAAAATPFTVTRALRVIEHAAPIAAVLAVGFFGSLAILAAPPLRRLARDAVLVWCVNLALAAVCLVVHHAADRRYQPAAVAGYLDEVPARLGADWQQTYLAPAFAAYNLSPP